MAIKFIKVDRDYREINVEPDDDPRSRSKKAAKLRQAVMDGSNKRGGVIFRGTVGTNTKEIVNAYNSRVRSDGGTVEALQCLHAAIQRMKL